MGYLSPLEDKIKAKVVIDVDNYDNDNKVVATSVAVMKRRTHKLDNGDKVIKCHFAELAVQHGLMYLMLSKI